MAEVGLVSFAKVALDVGRQVLPSYRSKFSKHIFSQPQLLAILCLMRYEDWTFREAEVRLREHVELRMALALERVPDYTSLYRFLRRLEEETVALALAEVARRLPSPPAGGTTVGVDATGLSPGAVSVYFVRRVEQQGVAVARTHYHHYIKWLVAVDIPRRVLLSQKARQGPANDAATLRPLVDAAVAVVPIHRVLADAEFDSELNHQHLRGVLAVESVIPAKKAKPHWKLHGVRAQMRQDFPRTVYAQRALVESVFSAVKRKLSAKAPGRLTSTQCMQALLLGLAYNIYRLKFCLWRPPLYVSSATHHA